MLIGYNRRFAIIGVAGYIAPRHLIAIKTLGCRLLCSHDLSDSVGIIDRYFPDASFTMNIDAFKNELIEREVEFLSVCTPNYLHASHAMMGMESGADVICEKPLALSMRELDKLADMQRLTGKRVFPILQLRLHPEIIKLKKAIESDVSGKIYDIDLSYITPRGSWYMSSWKGDYDKSGGLIANIGIHFIDMLHWIFGEARSIIVHRSEPDCVAGFILLEKARVRYFLSINRNYLPEPDSSDCAYRRMLVDGSEIDFSNGFTDLHTQSYAEVLDGNGFSLDDARIAIETLQCIRNSAPVGLTGDYHPMLLI